MVAKVQINPEKTADTMLKKLISINYLLQRPFNMLTKDIDMRYMLNMSNKTRPRLHISNIIRTFASTNKKFNDNDTKYQNGQAVLP